MKVPSDVAKGGTLGTLDLLETTGWILLGSLYILLTFVVGASFFEWVTEPVGRWIRRARGGSGDPSEAEVRKRTLALALGIAGLGPAFGCALGGVSLLVLTELLEDRILPLERWPILLFGLLAGCGLALVARAVPGAFFLLSPAGREHAAIHCRPRLRRALLPLAGLLGVLVALVLQTPLLERWHLFVLRHGSVAERERAVNGLLGVSNSLSTMLLGAPAYWFEETFRGGLRPGRAARLGIVDALADPDANVRMAACALVLCSVEDWPASDKLALTRALTACLRDTDPGLRRYAAYALGGGQVEPEAGTVTTFLELLADADADVRSAALSALGSLSRGSPALVAATEARLRDPVEHVRIGAVSALASFADTPRRSAEILGRLLDDPNLAVFAAEGLAELVSLTDAPEPRRALLDAVDSPSSFLRERVCWLLVDVSGAEVREALWKRLRDDDTDVRLAAAGALGSIDEDDRARVALYVLALDRNTSEERLWAARELLHADPDYRGTVPGLIRALDDPAGLVRAQSAQTLGSMGAVARAAEPALRRRLDDPLLPVRQQCWRALRRITR